MYFDFSYILINTICQFSFQFVGILFFVFVFVCVFVLTFVVVFLNFSVAFLFKKKCVDIKPNIGLWILNEKKLNIQSFSYVLFCFALLILKKCFHKIAS